MSLWDSLRTPLLSNDAWIEMSQTINAGLARINAANVIDAVTASATRLVEGITGTEAFQNALSVSREALGTASTSYMDAGVQEISNLGATVADEVSLSMSRAQTIADAAMAYVEAFEETEALDVEGITRATNRRRDSSCSPRKSRSGSGPRWLSRSFPPRSPIG